MALCQSKNLKKRVLSGAPCSQSRGVLQLDVFEEQRRSGEPGADCVTMSKIEAKYLNSGKIDVLAVPLWEFDGLKDVQLTLLLGRYC